MRAARCSNQQQNTRILFPATSFRLRIPPRCSRWTANRYSRCSWVKSAGSIRGVVVERPCCRTNVMATTSLDGASVLLLGATGGLGGALGMELAGRGATLTLVGRDRTRLEQLDIPGARVALDLRAPDACAAAVRAAVEHGGRLDVVINAVGVVAFGDIGSLSTDVMEELFMTNTFIPIMIAHEAMANLSSGGVMVNISGVIAEQNLPGMAAYGASKAAVRSFDEALAREARRQGVRVLDARPPHTETGLAGRAIAGTAPKMGVGLDPALVARIVCDAIESGATDLPSGAFSV
ncbi:MAG: SDR family NAD(P)-dependent oxidoreductase [Actinobacteria bacterium]|nr:SDR family NAD(P)-dependent oxidoreductase [Actinomycetota bacterium]